MIRLDERLGAIADLVLEAVTGREAPCAADVGCDHGFLTAGLLERCPSLTILASDVSAPSLQKARELLGWTAQKNLEDMCRDAWRWQTLNPNGYAD